MEHLTIEEIRNAFVAFVALGDILAFGSGALVAGLIGK